MRLHRAETDPVLVYQSRDSFAPPKDAAIYDDIRTDRATRYQEAPLTKRSNTVGWPETVIYLSTASLATQFATPEFRDAYKYAFARYLQEWHPETYETLPARVAEPPELDAYWTERLEDVRYGMKVDLDKHWVDHYYDEFDPAFPKQFLLSDYDIDRDPDSIDAYAQSALEEFT